mmetsp:Transcript_6292/g.15318  ORF Transcript_6292/g.15318 Transcript_6292/m.15318 type:complete len:147 (+) Transcript_6292:528-968(+)
MTNILRTRLLSSSPVIQLAIGDCAASIVGSSVSRFLRARAPSSPSAPSASSPDPASAGLRWPHNPAKSVIGSAAFVAAAAVVSAVYLTGFAAMGEGGGYVPDVESVRWWARMLAVSVAAALIETVPIGNDNFTIPLTAAVASFLLL